MSDVARSRRPAQSSYANEQIKSAGMVIFVLALLVGLVVWIRSANPDYEAHRTAWCAKVGGAEMFGTGVGEMIGTQKFEYHDYFLFSTMSQKPLFEGERTDSIGVFGCVYVFDSK